HRTVAAVLHPARQTVLAGLALRGRAIEDVLDPAADHQVDSLLSHTFAPDSRARAATTNFRRLWHSARASAATCCEVAGCPCRLDRIYPRRSQWGRARIARPWTEHEEPMKPEIHPDYQPLTVT